AVHAGIQEGLRSPMDGQQVTQRQPARQRGSGRFGHDPAGRRQALSADPGPDPVQPVRTRLDGFSDSSKLTAQHLFQIALPGPGLNVADDSRSKTERRATMARDASLLTAPMLSPMVVATCSSDRSP